MTDTAEDLPLSKCITAAEVRQAYLALVASRECGAGTPCLRDECLLCGPLNALIDQYGEACEARGCTMKQCIYD